MSILHFPSRQAPLTGNRLRILPRLNEGQIIFGLAVCLNLLAVWLLTSSWQIGNRDALSRTANAFYVIFSRDPHLAAIGFVWPPLPSLLQIPLLPLTRWLGQTPLSGAVVSSLGAALALTFLNRTLTYVNTPRALRWLLLALVQLHPAFWYLAASGLAEPLFLCAILPVVLGYLQMPQRVFPYAMAGLALGSAFFVRYEAIAVIAGLSAAIIVLHQPLGREPRAALGARLIMVLTPPIYTISLWMLWNWQIQGDPLYFQRSVYSLANAIDVARNAGPAHPLYLAWGSLGATAAYAGRRLFEQNLALPLAALVVAVLAWQRRDRQLAGLLLLLASVPAFSALQVLQGTLAPWMRYWIYATPFTAILIGVIAGTLPRAWRRLVLPPLLALFALSGPFCLLAMADPHAGPDEQRLHAQLMAPDRIAALRDSDDYWRDIHDAPILAAALDRYSADGPILVDSLLGYSAIIATRHPERLLITNDRQFEAALADPPRYVRYILVPEPTAGAAYNAILARYPALLAGGVDWARPEWQSQTTLRRWQIVRVLAPTTPAAQ